MLQAHDSSRTFTTVSPAGGEGGTGDNKLIAEVSSAQNQLKTL